MLDGEITIPDYTVIRGDRMGRTRGGAALYVKSNLYPMKIVNYSNGVCDYVIAKIRRLKALAISIYRPPDTRDKEWKETVDSMIENINLAQSHGDFERVIMGGDLNFGDIKWDGNGNVMFGNGLNNQVHEFAKLMNENYLINLVNKPTRDERI